MPEFALASLKVGGKAVKIGDATQFSYLLKAGKAPLVEAVSAHPGVIAEVRQAERVPGTAVVTLSDPQTGDSRIWTVNFGTAGSSEIRSNRKSPRMSGEIFSKKEKKLRRVYTPFIKC